jgi:hypothetical protein
VGAVAPFRSIVPAISVPSVRGAGLLFLQLSMTNKADAAIKTQKIKVFLFMVQSFNDTFRIDIINQ